MRKIPYWKLKRELKSTFEQVQALFITALFPLIRIGRKIGFKSRTSIIEGKRKLGNRISIYHIFPDSDDLSDRQEALNYLLRCGSSIICVVNGKISDHWIQAFSDISAYLLVRNNSGYDFGGYQAAIEHLQSTGHIYDHLHIINDSILMPIVENQSIMEDIEKAATTGFGGVASLPIDHKRPQGSQIALSYWLYFSGQITRSHAFASYWGSYIATNSKVLTVRHGERGISSHMIEAGHPPATLLSLEKLASKIESLDSRSLHAILKYGSYTDQNFIDQSRHLLKIYRDSGEWTDSARKFVIEVSNRRNYIHSFCFLAINVLGLPFIKKSDTMLIKLMREKYLEAVDSGDVDTKSSRLVEKILKVTRCTPHMTQDSIKNPAGPASG